jgi:hypothetical protein
VVIFCRGRLAVAKDFPSVALLATNLQQGPADDRIPLGIEATEFHRTSPERIGLPCWSTVM